MGKGKTGLLPRTPKIKKLFILPKDVVDDFDNKCSAHGLIRSAVIEQFMRKFNAGLFPEK